MGIQKPIWYYESRARIRDLPDTSFIYVGPAMSEKQLSYTFHRLTLWQFIRATLVIHKLKASDFYPLRATRMCSWIPEEASGSSVGRAIAVKAMIVSFNQTWNFFSLMVFQYTG